MTEFRVSVKTRCTMLVSVEADSMAEAKRLARACEYEPLSEWTPIDYGDLAVVYAHAQSGERNA